MSRIDKYNPYVGGFRAPLNFAIVQADIISGTVNDPVIYAVAINGSGRVIKGGSAVGALTGIIVPVRTMAIGEPIDVMRLGEVVEAKTTGRVAFAAGALVYGHADGTVDAVSASGIVLARMVEASRMIVMAPIPSVAV